MATSVTLGKLIRACVDDERTLRHESKLVGKAQSEALDRLAREREQFVTDLERLAKRERPHDGSWTELAREAERHFWVTVAGRNSSDAIASCRRSHARTQALYEEVLQAEWPEEIQTVLVEHRRRLRDETDQLIALQF